MINDDECEAVGEMRIGRGDRSIRENLPQCHNLSTYYKITPFWV
jgi:hypothetical protein